jgi:hypothetical protein
MHSWVFRNRLRLLAVYARGARPTALAAPGVLVPAPRRLRPAG